MSSMQSPSGTDTGTEVLTGIEPKRPTAIERQLRKMREGTVNAPAVSSPVVSSPTPASPEPVVVKRTGNASALEQGAGPMKAASDRSPSTSSSTLASEEQTVPSSERPSGRMARRNNVSAFPARSVRSTMQADAKALAEKVSTPDQIAELMQARKQLLISFYGHRTHDLTLTQRTISLLHQQDKRWSALQSESDATAESSNDVLFKDLGQAILDQLQLGEQNGSFKEHLLSCAHSGDDDQILMLDALRKRLAGASLLADEDVPQSVIAARKALGVYVNNMADLSHAHLDVAEPPTLSPELTQRKEALLQQMKHIAALELDPRERARRVKVLRASWHAVEKAQSQYEENLESQFKSASADAYEPSRRYFEVLAKRLAANLEKRVSLTTDLRDYYSDGDWSAPDWKAVEGKLQDALGKWKEFGPTDKEATHLIRLEFEHYFRKIQQRLNNEYERNKDSANELLASASSLRAKPCSYSSVEALLGLKKQWSALGVMRGEEFAELDAEFSSHSDAIMLARAEQLRELKILREKQAQALKILKQLDELTALDGEELLDARDNVTRLGAEFSSLGELPVYRGDELPLEFRKRYKQFFTKAEQMLALRCVRALHAFEEASALLTKAEHGCVSGGSAEEIQIAAEMARDYLGCIRYLPKRGNAILRNRLELVEKINLEMFDL